MVSRNFFKVHAALTAHRPAAGYRESFKRVWALISTHSTVVLCIGLLSSISIDLDLWATLALSVYIIIRNSSSSFSYKVYFLPACLSVQNYSFLFLFYNRKYGMRCPSCKAPYIRSIVPYIGISFFLGKLKFSNLSQVSMIP